MRWWRDTSALPLGSHSRVAVEAVLTIIRRQVEDGDPAAFALSEVERALQEPRLTVSQLRAVVATAVQTTPPEHPAAARWRDLGVMLGESP